MERREQDEWVMSAGGLVILSASSYRPILKSAFEQWQEDAPHRWWTKEEAQAVMRNVLNDHNQHAALVEQRDRLVEALELARKMFDYVAELSHVEQAHVQAQQGTRMFNDFLAEQALATVEQADESQAGGGSG